MTGGYHDEFNRVPCLYDISDFIVRAEPFIFHFSFEDIFPTIFPITCLITPDTA